MNTSPRSPDNSYSYNPDSIVFERAANVRTIGRPQVSKEFVIAGMTGYLWEPSQYDFELLGVANWEQYISQAEANEENPKLLQLPFGVRSGASVLSGLEAWKDEKLQVIDWVLKYQNQVISVVGGIDVGMTFDTIGTPKEKRELFAVPPHDVTTKKSDAKLWFNLLRNDLEGILASEPKASALIEGFDQLEELIDQSEVLA